MTNAELKFLDVIFSEGHEITDGEYKVLFELVKQYDAKEILEIFLKSPKHKRQREMLSKEELESLVFGDN